MFSPSSSVDVGVDGRSVGVCVGVCVGMGVVDAVRVQLHSVATNQAPVNRNPDTSPCPRPSPDYHPHAPDAKNIA